MKQQCITAAPPVMVMPRALRISEIRGRDVRIFYRTKQEYDYLLKILGKYFELIRFGIFLHECKSMKKIGYFRLFSDNTAISNTGNTKPDAVNINYLLILNPAK